MRHLSSTSKRDSFAFQGPSSVSSRDSFSAPAVDGRERLWLEKIFQTLCDARSEWQDSRSDLDKSWFLTFPSSFDWDKVGPFVFVSLCHKLPVVDLFVHRLAKYIQPSKQELPSNSFWEYSRCDCSCFSSPNPTNVSLLLHCLHYKWNDNGHRPTLDNHPSLIHKLLAQHCHLCPNRATCWVFNFSREIHESKHVWTHREQEPEYSFSCNFKNVYRVPTGCHKHIETHEA